MKYLIIAVAILLTGCYDNRPMSNDGKGSERSTTQGSNALYAPDYYYEIDTWGSNADVYEFTPRSQPNYICVVVGTGEGRTLQCTPKGE